MKTARGDKKNFFGYCRSQNLREILMMKRGPILCKSLPEHLRAVSRRDCTDEHLADACQISGDRE